MTLEMRAACLRPVCPVSQVCVARVGGYLATIWSGEGAHLPHTAVLQSSAVYRPLQEQPVSLSRLAQMSYNKQMLCLAITSQRQYPIPN